MSISTLSTHTCARVHTHHIHSYKLSHIHTHTLTHTITHSQVHSHTHTHFHTLTDTHAHTYIFTHSQTHMHILPRCTNSRADRGHTGLGPGTSGTLAHTVILFCSFPKKTRESTEQWFPMTEGRMTLSWTSQVKVGASDVRDGPATLEQETVV